MSRKVLRPQKSSESPGKDDGRKPAKRGKNRFGLKGGVPSLICIGMMFLAGGILAIVFPIPFASPGIPGKAGIPVVGSVYSSSQTEGWGVIFIVIGLLFLVAANRLQRD